MKKIIFLWLAAGCITFAACSKSGGPKDCQCTTHISGGGQNTTTTFAYTAEDGDCSSGNSSFSANGISQTTNCY